MYKFSMYYVDWSRKVLLLCTTSACSRRAPSSHVDSADHLHNLPESTNVEGGCYRGWKPNVIVSIQTVLSGLRFERQSVMGDMCISSPAWIIGLVSSNYYCVP